MTTRISLITVLAALAFAAIGSGGAVGVMLWEPWDGEDKGSNDLSFPSPSPEAENSFTITVETADDFQLATQQMADYLPDFDCAGHPYKDASTGIIDCGAGVTGFKCRSVGRTTPTCSEKEQLAPLFSQCSVEIGTAGGYLIECTGPNTNTACTVRSKEITCQRP